MSADDSVPKGGPAGRDARLAGVGSPGVLRKLTGKCPWDYSSFPGNIQGIITLEYAPVWFMFGLAFERVHDALVKLTPAIWTVLH
jgi:uncharacterized membrane protein